MFGSQKREINTGNERARGDSGGEEVAAAEREAATMVRALMDTRVGSGADQ